MKLEDKLRETMRVKHRSIHTENSYVGWYRQFVRFYGLQRHPEEMGTPEVTAFLTHLAVEREVAPSTQNQALNALVFLYRHVLKQPLEGVDAVRAKERDNLPVVLTVSETIKVLEPQQGATGCAIKLLYGCGLRVNECLRLRVKDIDLESMVVRIHRGKGGKDRILRFPEDLVEEMKAQLAAGRLLFERDRAADADGVYLPDALESKSPGAGKTLDWFWVFPSPKLSEDPRAPGVIRRHHIDDGTVNRAIQRAVKGAEIRKHVTAHTLRH